MYKTTWCKQLRMSEWAKENPKHKVLTHPLAILSTIYSKHWKLQQVSNLKLGNKWALW